MTQISLLSCVAETGFVAVFGFFGSGDVIRGCSILRAIVRLRDPRGSGVDGMAQISSSSCIAAVIGSSVAFGFEGEGGVI